MNKYIINFTKIKPDGNGNPRYVCHFLALVQDMDDSIGTSERYAIACKRANSIGGRKFHNKQYGGGIVFSSYNLKNLCEHIARVSGGNISGYTVDGNMCNEYKVGQKVVIIAGDINPYYIGKQGTIISINIKLRNVRVDIAGTTVCVHIDEIRCNHE